MSTIVKINEDTEDELSYEYQVNQHHFFVQDCLAVLVFDAEDDDKKRMLRVRNGDLPRGNDMAEIYPVVSDIIKAWLMTQPEFISDVSSFTVDVRRAGDRWEFS